MDRPTQIIRHACAGGQKMSQQALLGAIKDTSAYPFLAGLNPKEWTVLKFDPVASVACVKITQRTGQRVISVNIPTVFN